MDKDFLLQEIRHSVYGEAWHGPALDEALRGVTADEAAARPIPGGHTIWEITLHAVGWMEEAARRLHGAAPAPPQRGDWITIDDVNEAAWQAAQEELPEAMRTLEEAVTAFPEERLDEVVGRAGFEAELATGVSYRRMLSGVAQHNTYHAGQIMLLRRALDVGTQR